MNIDGWKYYNHAAIPNCYPHKEADITPVNSGAIWKLNRKILFARWITDFDCGCKTDFWACILDRPFDIGKLKAKHRYEINKGNRNFYCKRLNVDNIGEMYSVYIESLEGYNGKIKPLSKQAFIQKWKHYFDYKKVLLLGAFERETDMLCGYACCMDYGKYIPISSMKTRVSKERNGVNFALVYGICKYYEDKLQKGSYLFDGWRNLLHDTEFQPWLEKYFQFRKAYCILHIEYRKPLNILINILYPFRKIVLGKKLRAVLCMEECKRSTEANQLYKAGS